MDIILCEIHSMICNIFLFITLVLLHFYCRIILDLRNSSIRQILYQLTLPAAFIDIYGIKENIYLDGSLHKGQLLVKIYCGLTHINKYGYLQLHLTRHISYGIVHIKTIFHEQLFRIEEYMFFDPEIPAHLRAININAHYRVAPELNKDVYSSIRGHFPDVTVESRQSFCHETPFLPVETSTFHKSNPYRFQIGKYFTITLNPTGKLSIICKDFKTLNHILKILPPCIL